MYQELVMTVHAAQAPARLPQVLQFVGAEQIAGHAPILRGQTIALPGSIAAGCGLSSLYAAIPGYFDPDFDVATLDDGRDVVISWMVPISEVERQYVQENGWKAFEQKLTERDPDLLDIFREPLV